MLPFKNCEWSSTCDMFLCLAFLEVFHSAHQLQRDVAVAVTAEQDSH